MLLLITKSRPDISLMRDLQQAKIYGNGGANLSLVPSGLILCIVEDFLFIC